MQNRWEQWYIRELSTLVEVRHRIMMPLIERGLDVNLHIFMLYSWDTSTKSTYPNVLVELSRNRLTNFKISPVALDTINEFEACTRARRSTHRWGKVRLLFKVLHKFGASCQMTSEQNETEQRIHRLRKEARNA